MQDMQRVSTMRKGLVLQAVHGEGLQQQAVRVSKSGERSRQLVSLERKEALMNKNIYSLLARMSLAGYKIGSDMILADDKTKRNLKWEMEIEKIGLVIEYRDGSTVDQAKKERVLDEDMEFRRELRRARLRKLARAIENASKTKIVCKNLGVPMTEWEQAVYNYYHELYCGKR